MEVVKNHKNRYQIWTDSGWSDFDGLTIKGDRETVTVELDNGSKIDCTADHKIYTEAMIPVEAHLLTPHHNVIIQDGVTRVKSVKKSIHQKVYDIHNVHSNNRFYADGILVSNCEFLVFDETLINSLCLAGMSGIEPKMNMGQVRWYREINPNATYIISLDPSLGTGGDYAGLEVLELPAFHQVAEWHHNTTPIQGQVRIMRDICRYIDDQCQSLGGQTSIYYSVENNTVGEAALVAINELGEETYPGLFLSEPIRKGHVRRFRKGFNTTHKAKIGTCAKLKQLIEGDTLKIYSKPLLSQLKAYVAKGLSFEAKVGENDDLVASMLLNVRMVMMLQDWDPSVYEKIHEHVSDETILPLPIFIG